jgi:anti-sigma regulatory factor (Ser/Thr protein kinase)
MDGTMNEGGFTRGRPERDQKRPAPAASQNGSDQNGGGPLVHPAFFYSSLQDFLEVMVPYVAGGINGGHCVFVAARGDYLAPLRAELGALADGTRMADTHEWFPHPATRLRAFHELISDGTSQGAERLCLAGEPVWPWGPPELVREWQRYESILNAVLSSFSVSLMCLYDASSLDASILSTALRTHPTFHCDGASGPSPDFQEPEAFLRGSNPLPAPPPEGSSRMTRILETSAARRFLNELILRAGIEPGRAADLRTAANEVLTNALVYGGEATLTAWTEGDHFFCQIEDRGGGIADPMAGYRPPSEEGSSGRGLWISRQLVDLLQIVPTSAGTTVRMTVRRN